MRYTSLGLIAGMGMILLLVGCQGEEGATFELDEKYSVQNKSPIMEELQESQSNFVFSKSEVHTERGTEEILLALKNTQSQEGCFYLQPTCQHVVDANSCDTASLSDDSGTYWEWFDVPPYLRLAPNETIATRIHLTAEGVPNTYMSNIKLWYREIETGKCQEPDGYDPVFGLEQVGSHELRILLS